MTQIEALKLALEALKKCRYRSLADEIVDPAIKAIEKALAQPEQKPVAIKRMKEWIEYLKRKSDFGQHMKIPSEMSAGTCWELALELEQFINTTPPQRKPLTDEEIDKLLGPFPRYADEWSMTDFIRFARAIEAFHGIKENT